MFRKETKSPSERQNKAVEQVMLHSHLQEDDRVLWHEIIALRKSLGTQVLVLTHHYQRPELVVLGDRRGDSFELAKFAAQSQARDIVYCGVRFMAEGAAVLAKPQQRIFHPDPQAGCPMADMVDLPSLSAAWEQLTSLLGPNPIMPVVYMNSPADVKAFCGLKGGTVCTSANAGRAFKWAFDRAGVILFMPDEHLGRNTALDMGILPEELVLWHPQAGPWGGNDPEKLKRAKVVLWAGYCHVHSWFTKEHVDQARQKHPKALVVVHPECPREVVVHADGVGSTGYLVKAVAEAKPGSTVVVGTETNLVKRLALEYPDRKVVHLSPSLCTNMFRITLEKLHDTLKSLDHAPCVGVDDNVRHGATLALNRMLSLP